MRRDEEEEREGRKIGMDESEEYWEEGNGVGIEQNKRRLGEEDRSDRGRGGRGE